LLFDWFVISFAVIPEDSDSFQFTTTAMEYKRNETYNFRDIKEDPELRVHCQITYLKPPSRVQDQTKLTRNLKEMLSDNTFSDLTVTAAGGVTFSAHKSILAGKVYEY